MNRSDHVVAQKNGAELACLHCGQVQAVAMPCVMDVYLAIVEAWLRLHRDCPAPAPEEVPAS